MSREAPVSKTQILLGYMAQGEWAKALSLANTFRMLGPHRATIQRAHNARLRPDFYRAIGHDPDEAVKAGISALRRLYPTLPTETER